MTYSKFATVGLVMVMFAQSPAQSADIIRNGFFFHGLDDWTIFANKGTPGRTVNSGNPQVVMFDISGTGSQLSARLRVGDDDGPSIYGGSNVGGGGLSQIVNTDAGKYLFDVDFASYNPSAYDNSDGGLFAVLIDDIEYSSFNTGYITAGSTKRGGFNFTLNLASGNHVVKLQALRDALESADSPFQYFSNVSLSSIATPVPEPATWTMMLSGFALVGGAMRVRRRRVVMAI